MIAVGMQHSQSRVKEGIGVSVTGSGGGLLAHPRVQMTPARVTFLQLQRTNNTTRWQNVKAYADAQVALGSAYSFGDLYALPSLGEVYLATGAASYATRAGVILTNHCVLANFTAITTGVSADSGYHYRDWLQCVYRGMDWNYNGLTVPQRQQAASWLMDVSDWIWPESNSGRVGAWANTDPGSNYYWGFMQTGPAALAAWDDDTGTTSVSPGSGSNRPSYHRTLAENHWTSAISNFFTIGRGGRGSGSIGNGGLGGGFDEGTNYGPGSAWSLGRFVDAWNTAGLSLSATTFPGDAALWMMHTTMPGFAYIPPLGDMARESTGQMFVYNRNAMMVMAAAANGGGAVPTNPQIKFWLDQIGQVRSTELAETSVLAEELLYYDPSVVAATDLSALALSKYAEGAGFFLYHHDWTDPNATAWTFDAGFVTNHRTGMANALMIWKGAYWITSDAAVWSGSGESGNSADYNTYTIAGASQPLNNAAPGMGGKILAAPSVAANLVWTRGDAANAYGTPGSLNVLSKFFRTVAHLPDKDLFIVVDQLTTVTAADAKVMRWHCKNAPTVSGALFTLHNPAANYHAYGNVLLPATGVTVASESRGTLPSWDVTIATAVGTAAEVIVTTLEVNGGAAATHTVSAVNNGTNVIVTVDSTVTITVPLDGTSAVTRV